MPRDLGTDILFSALREAIPFHFLSTVSSEPPGLLFAAFGLVTSQLHPGGPYPASGRRKMLDWSIMLLSRHLLLTWEGCAMR